MPVRSEAVLRLTLGVLLLSFTGALAQDGGAVYRAHCSSCHDAGVGRAPLPAALRTLQPESVQSSLTQGLMARQGFPLRKDEIRDVSIYITGKKFGAVAPERDPCTTPAPVFDGALDAPHWNGWGVDVANQRSQPAAMAGLTAEQLPRLKVRWAFGFAGAFRAMAQPTVAGGRVFVSGSSGKVYSLDQATGCVRWSLTADSLVRTAISIGKIGTDWAAYFGDLGGSVYAVNATSGKLIWKVQVEDFLGAVITGAPTLYGGTLYVPVSSMEEVRAEAPEYECCRFRGSVAALDAETGKLIWKSYVIPDAPQPTVKNSAGTQMWGPSGAPVVSAPTVDPVQHAIYVTTGDAYSDPAAATTDAFVALSMDTGKILWSVQMTPNDVYNAACGKKGPNCPGSNSPDVDFLGSPILVSLPGGGRELIAGQKSGMVHTVDPDQQGKIRWQFRLGEGSIGWGGAVDDQKLYMPYSGVKWMQGHHLDPDAGGGMYALDLASGRMLWYAPPNFCDSKPGCSPAQSAAVTVIPGVVFSGSLDGHLRAYRTSDGEIIDDIDTNQTYKTVNGVPAHGGSMDGPGPAVADGMMFLNSGYGLGGGMPGNVLIAFSVDGK